MKKLKMECFEPTEADIKRSIRKYLDMLGIFNWPQWQGQFSVKGVPDLVGILPGSGRIVGIEVKRPGGRVTEHQSDFLDKINRSGGIAFVATCIQDVIEGLKKENKENDDHVERPKVNRICRNGIL